MKKITRDQMVLERLANELGQIYVMLQSQQDKAMVQSMQQVVTDRISSINLLQDK